MINRIIERIRELFESELDAAEKRRYNNCEQSNGYIKGITAAMEIVKEESKNNGWIPCSERLPKNQTESWWCTTEYLTCSKDGTIQVLCYSDGWNCSFLNADMDVWRDHEIKSVIAWMPLPSPYTENRKES